MAEIKDAFVCYRSYIDAIRLLPEDKRWGFFEKVICYSLDGVDPELQDYDTKLAFTLMKANIDSCNKRYKSSVINGKKGGAPKGNNNAKVGKKTTQFNPKDNVNVNETLLGASEGGDKTPPPHAEERFQMNGEWYEYYISGNGERRVRKLE